MRPETLKLTLMGLPAAEHGNRDNGMLHQSNSGVGYVNSGICGASDAGNVWTYIFKDFQKYNSGE